MCSSRVLTCTYARRSLQLKGNHINHFKMNTSTIVLGACNGNGCNAMDGQPTITYRSSISKWTPTLCLRTDSEQKCLGKGSVEEFSAIVVHLCIVLCRVLWFLLLFVIVFDHYVLLLFVTVLYHYLLLFVIVLYQHEVNTVAGTPDGDRD